MAASAARRTRVRSPVLSQTAGRTGTENYREAAGKHLVDADTLLKAKRADGAAYLAGYVVECSLKALIAAEGATPQHVHDFGSLLDRLNDLATRADVRTARRYVRVSSRLHSASIHGWRPAIRYEAPRIGQAEATGWLGEAGSVYGEAVGQLALDGS